MSSGHWRSLQPKALRVAAEPELRIESREQLVYLLTQACELEHGLMCEYLFAQFSLKRSTAEGVTESSSGASSRGRTRSWAW